ncbi:MAG: S8 family serine peptidase [Xanthomonadales bacterium]|nr:S8 family serine peptidase [Xanthomonadales bacterium]
MRTRHCRLFHLALVVLLAGLAPGLAAAAKIDPEVEQALRSTGTVRVLVWIEAPAARQSSSAAKAAVAELLAAHPALEAKIRRRFETLPAFAAELAAEDLDRLRRSDTGVRIGLDVGGGGGLLESIPLAQVQPVQLAGLDGSGRKVVIIDSGLRLDHLSFAGRVVDEACFCTTCCPNGQITQFGPGAALDAHGHGTNVGGIAVGAAGVSGVPRGVASGASIVAVRVLDQNNSFCCSSDVIAAYDWVRVNHPDATVINASLGTSARFQGNCDAAATFTQTFATVINNLRGLGVLATVSSGNNGSSIDMQAPACVASALAVGAVYDASVGSASFGNVCTAATTAADQVTCFSNLSTTTDLLAPGAPVTAAGRSGASATSTFSGTSMAAPMTAGCIALLKQAVPEATPDAIEAALEASTVRLLRPPMTQSYPRLDCAAALLQLTPELFSNGFEAP